MVTATEQSKAPERKPAPPKVARYTGEVVYIYAFDVAYDMTSSMHHDLERGNPLEIRWLSGGVVELGRRKGVPTPLNRAIADILALHAPGKMAAVHGDAQPGAAGDAPQAARP